MGWRCPIEREARWREDAQESKMGVVMPERERERDGVELSQEGEKWGGDANIERECQ